MADTDEPADAAARLEKALERIAVLAGQVASPARPDPGSAAKAAAVAQRLDSLIAKLRAALAVRPG